jgi:hypothetical protein
MAQFSTHSYFENSTEEFHFYEILSTNFHHLFLHQYSVTSAYLMPMKLYETLIEICLMVLRRDT